MSALEGMNGSSIVKSPEWSPYIFKSLSDELFSSENVLLHLCTMFSIVSDQHLCAGDEDAVR